MRRKSLQGAGDEATEEFYQVMGVRDVWVLIMGAAEVGLALPDKYTKL